LTGAPNPEKSEVLFIVPGERHIERLARDGKKAETRASLRSRLVAALLPAVPFVGAHECRLVLGMTLDRFRYGAPTRGAPTTNETHIFVGAYGHTPLPAVASPALANAFVGAQHAAPLPAIASASWTATVTAIDKAISTLRARGVTASMLERVASRSRGVLAQRAGVIGAAMATLDERLASFGVRDERLARGMLAQAIAASSADNLALVIGATRLRARWLLAWDPMDLAWWRAIDEKFSPLGFARIVLPAFERRLEAERERDPLEALADDIARMLDAPPESEPIASVLGDLSLSANCSFAPDLDRIALVSAANAAVQAREAAAAVSHALHRGARIERVVIAFPAIEETSLGPLRRALDDVTIASFCHHGPPSLQSPAVACALAILDVAETLSRREVARLFRSGYVDPARLAPAGVPARDAAGALVRIAQKLESRATAAGSDPAARLIETVIGHGSQRVHDALAALDLAMVRSFAKVLAMHAKCKTRQDRIVAARAIWSALGIGAQAGRGGLPVFGRDEAIAGAARALRDAIAWDASAWDALVSAMDLYETTAHRAAALGEPVGPDQFRAEFTLLLDTPGVQPNAGRAGAVRIARLADVVGDELDLLVILDANERRLLRDEPNEALVSGALTKALSQVCDVRTMPTERRVRDLCALGASASEAARVVMISVREDAAGAPLLPSPVVTSLQRAGGAMNRAPTTTPIVGAPFIAPHRGISDVGAYGHTPLRNMRVENGVALRIRREREREGFFLAPSRPRSDVIGQLVSTPTVRAALAQSTGGGQRALSITALERFARCPFHGFAHAVIVARETHAQGELPDAREQGLLVHEALAAAFDATRIFWPERPRDLRAIVDAGLRAADEIFDRWQGHAPLRAVVRLSVRESVRALLTSAAADDRWNFEAAEQSFGGREGRAWPDFVIEGEHDRLVLRGTIDRIDRGREGLRIVDYKRSKNAVRELAKGLGTTALQVPLYACVSANVLSCEATGTYLPSKPGDTLDAQASARIEAFVRELATRAEPHLLSPIEHRALDLVTKVRSGGLAPTPASEAECRTCAMSGGCRKPRFAMAPTDDEDVDEA